MIEFSPYIDVFSIVIEIHTQTNLLNFGGYADAGAP